MCIFIGFHVDFYFLGSCLEFQPQVYFWLIRLIFSLLSVWASRAALPTGQRPNVYFFRFQDFKGNSICVCLSIIENGHFMIWTKFMRLHYTYSYIPDEASIFETYPYEIPMCVFSVCVKSWQIDYLILTYIKRGLGVKACSSMVMLPNKFLVFQ